MGIDCDLVLPCRDEAAALPDVLTHVPGSMQVIVVDNGSSDGTARVAREHGARVVTEPRAGYGAAVDAGLRVASSDLVAFMDGDGSLTAADLLPLIDDVASGRADLALGRRRPIRPGVWPWHARLGNRLVLGRLRRRTGLALHDIAPMRVAWRSALLTLDVRDRRFGYPVELLVRAQAAGWVITEHDVAYRPRATGTRSKVSGSVTGSTKAMRDFVRVLP
jgi:glycosyltransferase involved in cell wall biosynthesis